VPRSSSPNAAGRRALIADIKDDTKGWLRHGIAALAISVLGLGVAGSVVLTGAAQDATTADRASSTEASRDREAAATSRGSDRAALDSARLESLADQRAEELNKSGAKVAEAASSKAAKARQKLLDSASDAAQREAARIASGRGTSAGNETSPEVDLSQISSSGKGCLPVAAGYTIAARFGQVGIWSRYHTGFDFSAPVGTPLRASAAGVVTNAGIGPASGWAGNYVAIKHADGTHSMLSHMSTVSVQVGQTVDACQNVGAIGMTGRTFGAHVHFEVYPVGVEAGDIYRAVNPLAWLTARGVQP
jgi:murein DD-endopeptidase MepM/ murein hydrolase activator NlpD